MDAEQVRERIAELIYTVQFDQTLHDSARMEFISASIRDRRNVRHSPMEYADAIASVMSNGHLPANALGYSHHSEDEVLDWLRRLAEQLDAESFG